MADITKKVHAEVMNKVAGQTYGSLKTTYHLDPAFNTNPTIREEIINMLVAQYQDQYNVLLKGVRPTQPYVLKIDSLNTVTYIYINHLIDNVTNQIQRDQIISDAKKLQEDACTRWKAIGWTKFPTYAYSGPSRTNYIEKWTWNFK